METHAQPNDVQLQRRPVASKKDGVPDDPQGVRAVSYTHLYADLEYPDRSALIFAPEPHGPDDGLLQVREIRTLHLKAKLVTLSACDTGVGPVGEAGVDNLVNAFIEAGADSVVSTLWELEDLSLIHI